MFRFVVVVDVVSIHLSRRLSPPPLAAFRPLKVRVEHVAAGGKTAVLAKAVKLQAGEVADATRMDVASLRAFYAQEMDACQALGDDVLLSLHLKATMMKVG